MAKTYIDTVKYIVYADVEVDGMVDKPDVVGAIFGAVLIVLIRNGMDLMNISSYLQMCVMGCLLIFAVVMDQLRLSVKMR